MIQRIEQRTHSPAVRRTLAVMTALWLNLSLLPCAMALDALDKAHDCCPPTVELQPLECCEIDAVPVDKRDSGDSKGDVSFGPVDYQSPYPSVWAAIRQVTGPPGPTGSPASLHVLNCVYLI